MALTINGVTVTIMEDGDGSGIAESVPDQGAQATVQFKCPWANRWDVVKGLMGSVTSVGGTILRTPPLAYPDLPTLFCTSIGSIKGIKPRVDGTGWLIYDSAIVAANFTLPAWNFDSPLSGRIDPSGLPYTTTRCRTSAEIFSPPGASYYFPDGTPIKESGVGLVRLRAEIVMTRHLLPYPPLALALYLGSTVNDDTVALYDYEFPAGSLLFLGMDAPEAHADPSTGEITFDCTFNFLGNYELSWNEFMKDDGLFYVINSKADGSGNPPFFKADFSPLFSDNLQDFAIDTLRADYI